MNAIRTPAPVAYRDADTGATWSGRGRKPTWVAMHLENGGTLEDIKVAEAPEETGQAVAEEAPTPHDHTPSQLVAIGVIVPSPTNPRKTFDETDMTEMTRSVQKHGVIQPILLRPIPAALAVRHPGGLFELVAGERRFQAARAAGLTDIPALVRDLSDIETLELQILENLQRKGLNELEEAEGFKTLMESAGYTVEALAAKLDKSKGYVYAALKLTALGKEARQLFTEGKLDASTALLIARIPVPALQVQAAKEITTPDRYNGDTMSFRRAKEYIRHNYQLKLDNAPFDPDDSFLWIHAGKCSICPKRAGNAPDDFPDTPANVCTDPACFAVKKQNAAEQRQREAAAEGKKVIVGDAARALLPYDSFDRIKGMVRLDATCYDMPPTDKGRLTYRDMLGEKAANIVLIEKQEGGFVECVERTEGITATLKAALQSAGVKSSSEKDAEDKLQDKIDTEYRRRLGTEVRAQFLLILDLDDLRIIAKTLIDRLDHESTKALMRWWYPAEDVYAATKRVQAALPTMVPSDLYRFLMDAAIVRETMPIGSYYGGNRDPETLMRLATRNGIDPERVRREATEACQPRAKHPAKKAK